MRTKTITLNEEQFKIVMDAISLLRKFQIGVLSQAPYAKNIDEVVNLLNTIPYNEGR